MTKHFYRFRSIKALLDDQIELVNQEIYFASPAQLNDPMEGFRMCSGKVIASLGRIFSSITCDA